MRINDFERMQRNLNQMKENLEQIQKMDKIENVTSNRRLQEKNRRAVKREINKLKHPTIAKIAKDEQNIVLITIAIVAVTFIFSTSIFAKTITENIAEKKEDSKKEVVNQSHYAYSQHLENNEENVEENIENNKIEESEENRTSSQNVVVVSEDEKQEIQVEENNKIEDDKESENNEVINSEDFAVEFNENAIQIEDILLENVSVLKSKEYAEEVRDVQYEVIYNDNPTLPKNEKVITKKGEYGSEEVTVIKSYENDEFVSENIIESNLLVASIAEEVDVGTSEFLAKNDIHIGDTIYVTSDVKLKESPNSSSANVGKVLNSLDVKLEELCSEEWCKVKYDKNLTGYVKTNKVTSSTATPEIVDKNRIQKIKMVLNKNMDLNHSTGLTLDDYKKILSGNSSDSKHVISDNAEAFYNADVNYNMNGILLASMAIHESAWGTSTIANNKHNLFGYGAYDSSPYASSFTFDTYAEGIDTVARVLVKYYLNPAGTAIYEDEVAKGSYYNGSTVADINKRYASDVNWHNKVYSYMEFLYNKL